MTKEETYDTEIAPLMTKIIAICKRESIAMIADFYLGDDLHCTTATLNDEHDPSPSQIQAFNILKPRG